MVSFNLRKRLLRRRRLQKVASNNEGFTLLELLIALIMSGVIFAGLMTLIVNFLQIDRREAKLDQLQQDTRRAADFIADDLREAIYVYDLAVPDPADPDALALSDLAPYITAGSQPVLALWRPVPIDADDELANIEDDNTVTPPVTCNSRYDPDADAVAECEILKARRASYSLVIYAHRLNVDGEPWQGPARIERYELPKYVNLANAADPFDITDGYTDPTDARATDTFNQLENWPASATGPALIPTTLVDQIGLNYTVEDAAIPEAQFVDCAAVTGGAAGQYAAVPANATEDSSFYACVRDPSPDPTAATDPNNIGVRASQDVYLVVQGDPRIGVTDGAGGIVAGVRGNISSLDASDSYLNGASEGSRYPEIEARVNVGGGVNRDG